MNHKEIKSFGELKKAGYQSRSIKEEMRLNLIHSLKENKKVFEGIVGYDDSVIPEIERAVLSKHNIILLGLRGQAKTRIARQMTGLLDEYIPYLKGSQIYDDPFNPISKFGIDLLREKGENAEISWLHRSERYAEKLATPDVSVADLIGDIDPIKAATLKLSYSDEEVIHYGIIPRSNRCIFTINELPDLQARIQVALFNILEEGDIQIRGFKLRMPLDIQFVFTANPEDYTNRGSIVTPLKDRIESQILTHYPKTLELSREITRQEANDKEDKIFCPEAAENLIEQIAIEARESEFIDSKSGVSARLTISAKENLLSSAERRMILNNEKNTTVRVSDFWGVIPSITGKIELVYEGEQEGPFYVALNLIGKSIRSEFIRNFPNPEDFQKKKAAVSPFRSITEWFSNGNSLDILNDVKQKEYRKALDGVQDLEKTVLTYIKPQNDDEKYFMMEFLLHGLAEYSLLSKKGIERGIKFEDLMNTVFSLDDALENDDYDEM